MTRARQIGTIIITLVILVLIGYVVYTNFKPEALPEYNVTEIKLGDIQSTYETSGTVVSDNTETYTAISGVKVTSVNVSVGETVKEGDIIAQFDVSPLNAKLKEYKTAYDKALKAYNDSLTSINSAKQNKANALSQINSLDAEIAQLEQEISAAENATSQTPDIPEYSQEQLDALVQKLKDGGFTQEEIDKIIASLKNSAGSITKEDIESAIANATATKKLELTQKQSQKQILETQVSLYDAQTDDTASSIYKNVMEQKKSDYENYKAIVDEMKNGWVASSDGLVTEVNITAGETFAPKTSKSTTTDLSSLMSYVSGDSDMTSVLSDIIGSVTDSGTSSGAGVVIENTNEFVAEFSVGKYDILSIKVGQKVKVSSLGSEYDGEVIYVSATASESSSLDISTIASTFTGGSSSSSNGALVRIKINNPDEKIIIGFDVDIKIDTEKVENVLVLPIDAVVSEDSVNYVYVIDEDNKVSKREITVGSFSDDDYELLSGVEAGEIVVDNPKTSMAEGDKIAIKK